MGFKFGESRVYIDGKHVPGARITDVEFSDSGDVNATVDIPEGHYRIIGESCEHFSIREPAPPVEFREPVAVTIAVPVDVDRVRAAVRRAFAAVAGACCAGCPGPDCACCDTERSCEHGPIIDDESGE